MQAVTARLPQEKWTVQAKPPVIPGPIKRYLVPLCTRRNGLIAGCVIMLLAPIIGKLLILLSTRWRSTRYLAGAGLCVRILLFTSCAYMAHIDPTGQPWQQVPALMLLGGLVFVLEALLSLIVILMAILELGSRQVPRRLCAKCGYLLAGLREPRCPECGTPFDPSLLQARPSLEGADRSRPVPDGARVSMAEAEDTVGLDADDRLTAQRTRIEQPAVPSPPRKPPTGLNRPLSLGLIGKCLVGTFTRRNILIAGCLTAALPLLAQFALWVTALSRPYNPMPDPDEFRVENLCLYASLLAGICGNLAIRAGTRRKWIRRFAGISAAGPLLIVCIRGYIDCAGWQYGGRELPDNPLLSLAWGCGQFLIMVSPIVVALGVQELWFERREASRIRRGLCPDCGYNLVGLQGQPCPQCGRPSDSSLWPRVDGSEIAAQRDSARV